MRKEQEDELAQKLKDGQKDGPQSIAELPLPVIPYVSAAIFSRLRFTQLGRVVEMSTADDTS